MMEKEEAGQWHVMTKGEINDDTWEQLIEKRKAGFFSRIQTGNDCLAKTVNELTLYIYFLLNCFLLVIVLPLRT